MGSTTQQVLALAPSSLLVVPPDLGAGHNVPAKRVLVAVDGSLRTQSVLPEVAQLARFHDAQVLLVNYQYRSFGVPALALRRGTEDDLVMAPYACVLALRLQPRKVLVNLAALTRLGALGTYGLFEAVDYHPIRADEALREPLRPPRAFSIVRSYMAHHQGMVLAALNNTLNKNVLVERFHADPRVKSGELLLSEPEHTVAACSPCSRSPGGVTTAGRTGTHLA